MSFVHIVGTEKNNKLVNKKWLKKYGVTMVEYTVKNARLEHNYITNT